MLRRALRTGNLPHSYLFAGVEGTGKHALAIAFAMTLNCLSEVPAGQPWPDTPCLICPSCSRTLRGAHPDLIEINLETQAQALGESSARTKTGQAKELKIDVIREMQDTVGLSPHSGRWKVYVIGDAGRLNEEASNCLLKTLEEPPAHTVIILLAPDESAVLPTISSRCFMVPVRPVPAQVEAEALEDYLGAESEQAKVLAALSGGRLGYAVGLLEDKEGLNRRRKALEEMSLLSGAPVVERVNASAKWAKLFTDARPELYELLDTWEGWWRDVLLVSASAPELVANVDHVSTLRSLARKNSPTRASSAVTLIQATRQQLLENVNPRLALEALALGLP
jgi:DNA polymerase-3 subunit delta'